MDDAGAVQQEAAMGMGKAVGIFVGAMVVLVIMASIAGLIGGSTGFAIGVGSYLFLGIVLNRIVLRGLIEWHPLYNTVDNVASAKIGLILFWPIRYPILFIKVLITKHL